MTYDSQIAATLGSAAQDWRDKISGVTGWSVAEDTVASSLTEGDYTVFTAPNGEHVRLNYGQISTTSDSDWQMRIEHGEWDTGSSSWTTQYGSRELTWMPTDFPNGTYGPSMNVEYWLEYVPRGFVLYVRRVEGDGNDQTSWCTWSRITKLWDYDAADTPESDGYIESQVGDTQDIFPSTGARTRAGLDRDGGRGLLNPDTSLSNFPWVEWVVYSHAYRDGDTSQDTPIGTSNLALYDRSGTSTNHGDVVQDGGGADTYMVLKTNGVKPLLIRMD